MYLSDDACIKQVKCITVLGTLCFILCKLWYFSGPGAGKPCVFPFKITDVTYEAYGCLVLFDGQKVLKFLLFFKMILIIL